MTYVFLSLFFIAFLFAIFYAGKLTAEKRDVEEDVEDFKKEAQEHANTPLTPFDFTKQLRARIKQKNKT